MCCTCNGMCNHTGPHILCSLHSRTFEIKYDPTTPVHYTQFNPFTTVTIRDYGSEIDALKARIEELERKQRGKKTKAATIQL